MRHAVLLLLAVSNAVLLLLAVSSDLIYSLNQKGALSKIQSHPFQAAELCDTCLKLAL